MGADMDWTNSDGSRYQYPVLIPDTAVAIPGDMVTESGVSAIILLEFRGTLDGEPMTLAVELSPEAAGKVSAGLTAARER